MRTLVRCLRCVSAARLPARLCRLHATACHADGVVMTWHRGAENDLERLVRTHLFVICPNNSGSTFLKNALATSRRTWNLLREGQNTFGFAGPRSIGKLALGWASDQRWIDRFTDSRNFDWPRIRRAWYFQAFSLS